MSAASTASSCRCNNASTSSRDRSRNSKPQKKGNNPFNRKGAKGPQSNNRKTFEMRGLVRRVARFLNGLMCSGLYLRFALPLQAPGIEYNSCISRDRLAPDFLKNLSMSTFQDVILTLTRYWGERGCAILQPYDMEVGAGTSHTATFLRAIGPEPWRAAYVQPSRRPKDGRYGENPNRLQHYYQYQVVLKPSPDDIQDLYLDSLRALGVNLKQHDVRFVEDDWESPTLGASGLGWEVWLDGMEITQFTYFQEVGSLPCKPVLGEITYGLERLAMYLQEKENVFDLVWTPGVTYRDVYHQNEVEQSKYNFEA